MGDHLALIHLLPELFKLKLVAILFFWQNWFQSRPFYNKQLKMFRTIVPLELSVGLSDLVKNIFLIFLILPYIMRKAYDLVIVVVNV